MTRTRRREIAALVLMGAGAGLLGFGLYMPAKAALMQVLLERSWAAARTDTPAPRPWPWAETRPVARIEVPRLKVSSIVLAGPYDHSPPFGPGHVDGTVLPGTRGHSVVAAHRDTHFKLLRFLRLGDVIRIERPGGAQISYIVVEIQVLDTRSDAIVIDEAADMLSLVTCYPFTDWKPGGPLRFVVTAVADRPDA